MNDYVTYQLNIVPQYLPNREAPEALAGQVTFQDSIRGQIVCRVEVRAEWKVEGTVEVAQPDPAELPNLTTDQIQERARRFAALFRDDKVQGVTEPDARERELEAFQASEQ